MTGTEYLFQPVARASANLGLAAPKPRRREDKKLEEAVLASLTGTVADSNDHLYLMISLVILKCVLTFKKREKKICFYPLRLRNINNRILVNNQGSPPKDI